MRQLLGPIKDCQALQNGKKWNKFTYQRRQLTYKHDIGIINREHTGLFKDLSPI